jgi:hypothetical protein
MPEASVIIGIPLAANDRDIMWFKHLDTQVSSLYTARTKSEELL